ncbi:MAG: ribosome-associated translation inhibitor RaiA [Phycisphaerales bacterium]|jgi:putative sigma-54 modulation protein|nr:ribosome-associated translation inhibitor RaiA [Phycisphaerales bacterium]
MQVNISSKLFDMTPAIEEYVRGKSEKLTRFFDRIEQINVLIEKTTHGYTSEIIADVEHHDPIVANNENDDMHASIDGCVDRAVRQLSDLKSRLRDDKHNTPTGGNQR